MEWVALDSPARSEALPPCSTQSKPFLPTPAFAEKRSTLAFSIRVAMSLVGNAELMTARWEKRVDGIVHADSGGCPGESGFGEAGGRG